MAMKRRTAVGLVLLALCTLCTAAVADLGVVGRYSLHPPNGNGIGPRDIAFDGGQLFIANMNSHNLSIATGHGGDVIWTVPVGSFPRAVDVDRELQRAFVANAGDDTVTVVDAADWNVIDTVAVGREPLDVAINQTTHRVYVSNHGPSTDPDDTVTIINASSYEVIDTVSVGGRPGYIAIDETTNLIYVMLWGDSRIAVIDGATNAVGYFDGFSSYHGDIALNAATDDLYLLDYYQGKLVRFELSTRTYTSQITIGSYARRMAIDTENNMLYVAKNIWVDAFDLDGFYYYDSITLGTYSEPEQVAIAPDQGYFYVICGDATLRQYRISDFGLVHVEPIAVKPIAVAANSVSGKVYAAADGVPDEAGDVYALSNNPPGYKLRISVAPEPIAVAVNPVTNKIYVTNDGEPYKLTVIDGSTDQILVERDHRGAAIAVNPLSNRIYTISGSRLTAIDGSTDTVLPWVETRYSAAGYIGVDPALDRVYVSSLYSRGRLMVHDGTTLDEVAYLSLGGTDIEVDSVNHIVYAGDWDAGVNVIDGVTNTLITEIPLPIEARYLALDPVDRKLYVADTETNQVVVVDTVTNSIVGAVTTDSGVFDIATDGVNPVAYAANRNAGTITLLGEALPVPVQEREALLALYNATGGPDWSNRTNWLSGDPCANGWHGVSCDLSGPNVTGIQLGGNGLAGSLPSELGDLDHLEILDLSSNQLTGAIPAELGGVATLTFLSLAANALEGSIPEELGSLAGLESLQLQANRLMGLIPDGLINLSGLQTGALNIAYNGLYTSNPALDSFLDSRSGADWSATQTIAPRNVWAQSAGGEAASVAWGVIEYLTGPGRYRVLVSRDAGGPYQDAGTTDSKSDGSLVVSGLSPAITYHFVVQAETDSHVNNANSLVSPVSVEASATPVFLNEVADFEADHDFLTEPLDGTPFTLLDMNDGFDIQQDALVTALEANTIEPGSLVITSQNASWRDAADDGVFLGLTAYGNFIARMAVRAMTASPGHGIGLMARVPGAENLDEAGPGQDWVAIGLIGDIGQVETRDTDDGVTAAFPEFQSATFARVLAEQNGSVQLRLERTGSDSGTVSEFVLSYRFPGDADWTDAVSSPIVRPDFTGQELEIGIYHVSTGEATAVIDEFSVRNEKIFTSSFE